jgi:hypothetical protein
LPKKLNELLKRLESESSVIVYDGIFWSREGIDLKNLPEKTKLFYFLNPGDEYDLLNRLVEFNLQ